MVSLRYKFYGILPTAVRFPQKCVGGSRALKFKTSGEQDSPRPEKKRMRRYPLPMQSLRPGNLSVRADLRV